MIRTKPAPPRPREAAVIQTDNPQVPFAPMPFEPEEGKHLYGRRHLDDAQRAWQAHVDAGRIGARPQPSAEWLAGQAEMERIFRIRRGNIW